MKKYAFVLLAGSFLGLAACGDNTNTTTQEQIDSTVNARSAAIEAEAKAKNDSLINAMAKMRADSAMMADSLARVGAAKPGSTSKSTKPVIKTTTTTTTTTKSPGGFGSQADAHRIKDKTTVEGGGFGSQSDKKQLENKKSVESKGFGSQADDRKK